MSRICPRPGIVILLGLLAVGPVVGSSVAGEGGSVFLSPSEVRPGMRGIARTVFAGNQAQEFPVELLGVLSGTRPKGDLILFRALGDTLARTGVVAGMSGSPVYVDGRLVGAIAFSYPFSKEPIGMITPIGEMLEGMERPDEEPYPWLGNPTSQFEPMLRGFVSRTIDQDIWDQLVPVAQPEGGAGALLALWASDWSPEVAPVMERIARRAGLPSPVAGSAAGSAMRSAMPATLEPGSAVGVMLIDGDASLSAIGTLTYRSGEKIAAFGHPMFQGGAVDLPLTAAWIHAIVPSYNNSFKVGSAGPVVGSIRRDFRAGVAGTLGPGPDMLPVRIVLEGPSGRDTYHYRIARGTALEPTLLAWTTTNSLLQHGWRMGEANVDARLTIHYNAGQVLTRRDRMATRSPATEIAERLLAPVPLLITNPFARVSLDSVDLELTYKPEARESVLVDLWAERDKVRAGDVLDLAVRLQDHQKQNREIRVAIPVPERWRGRTLLILAGGAKDLTDWDKDRVPALYEPKDLDGLERLLRDFPDEGDLLVRIYGEEDGVLLGDRELGPLPASVTSVLGARHKRGPARPAPNHRMEERRIDAGGPVTGGLAVRVAVE